MKSSLPQVGATSGAPSHNGGVRFSAQQLTSLWKWVLLAGLGVALLSFGAIGFYSRYLADDYCTASQLRVDGFLGAQTVWYLNWSGRFASTFLITLFEMFGVQSVILLPTIGLVVWLVAQNWAILYGSRALRRPLPALTALVLAGLWVYCTLAATPNLIQSLYWQTGILTYTFPLILLCLVWALIAWRETRARKQSEAREAGMARHADPGKARVPTRVLWGGLCAALTFTAGGTSEIYSAFQAALFALVSLVLLVPAARHLVRSTRVLVLIGFLGAFVALLVMALSPGNQIRQPDFTSPDWQFTLSAAWSYASSFARLAVSKQFATLFFALLTSSALTFFGGEPTALEAARASSPRALVTLLLLPPVFGFALLYVCFLPPAYALRAYPPARALIVPYFVLVGALILWGICCGLVLRARVHLASKNQMLLSAGMLIVALVLCVGFPLATATANFARVPVHAQFAEKWDHVDAELRRARTQGIRNATAPLLGPSGGLEHISSDPKHWLNRCISSYYRFRSIKAQ